MKQFGGKLTDELKEEFANSPNWQNGKFVNLEETTMDLNFQSLPKLLYRQLFERNGREPKRAIPIHPFKEKDFFQPSPSAKVVWYGHSAIMLRMGGKNVLIDPMLGRNASPIAPFETKRFSEGSLEVINDLPAIDAVFLSHDHYDHLDYASIKKLLPLTTHYFTALGVGRHLQRWGVSSSNITEMDWWQQVNWDGILVSFTPSRHFSGRGVSDRSKSLWGGWALQTDSERIYFSGDGGYGKHFQEIGERLGPFDLGFMECGQYNEHWHQIHMYPEESVQAALDARVKIATPVHWGAFSLSLHSWKEPANRFVKAADNQKLRISTPELGKVTDYRNLTTSTWWEALE